jgi:hypothetical protein
MSGLPPLATGQRTSLEVRFVPTGDIAVFYVAEAPSQSIEQVSDERQQPRSASGDNVVDET